MIYDQIEQAYSIASQSFPGDLAALATAKNVSITTSCTFVKRQHADLFVQLGIVTPACGVYLTRVVTAVKSQTHRDVTGAAVFDYYATDPDPVKLAKQVELAAEALLKSVDRLCGGDIIYGAGVLDDSITVELSDGYEQTVAPNYWRRALVRFPLYDRDTGL